MSDFSQIIRFIVAMVIALVGLTACTPPTTAETLDELKLVNYYPTDAGWTLMWTKFPIGEMTSDFGKMHAMGANSVRIILQASTIGYPNPTVQMRSELAQIVKAADRQRLTVQLTLFDGFDGYTEIANSTHWAQVVLAPYKNDRRISFVELKNEVDVNNRSEMSWAQTMYPIVKADIGSLPLTLSLPGNAPAGALATVKKDLPNMDFYDVHDYGSVTAELANDRKIVAPAPLYVGEAGQSTLNTSEASQAEFFKNLNATTRKLGLPPASPWAWQDFVPGSLTWVPASSSEYHFGLLHVNGSAKPAFTVEQNAFG